MHFISAVAFISCQTVRTLIFTVSFRSPLHSGIRLAVMWQVCHCVWWRVFRELSRPLDRRTVVCTAYRVIRNTYGNTVRDNCVRPCVHSLRSNRQCRCACAVWGCARVCQGVKRLDMKTNWPTIPFTKAGSPRSTTHVRMRNSRSRLQRTPIMDHSQTSEIHSHNARPKSQSQRTTIEIREEERKMRGAEVYSGGRRRCPVRVPLGP